MHQLYLPYQRCNIALTFRNNIYTIEFRIRDLNAMK